LAFNISELQGLFDYIEENILVDDIFDPKEELLACKHTLKATQIMYDGILQRVKQDPSQSNLQLWMTYGDRLREEIKEYIDVLKKAAETNAITAAKLDSVQVLALLAQVPKIISSYLEKGLEQIFDDIRNHAVSSIPSSLHSEKWFSDLMSHEYLNHNRVETVNSYVVNVRAALQRQIREVRVPGTTTGVPSSTAPVTAEEVAVLMGTVPLNDS
jgi:hypothetical protein